MEATAFALAILTALPYFLRLETGELRRIDESQFTNTEDDGDATYDFIVVGGGTAGCVVAGRLSEKFSVLLVEAGGDPPSSAEVPAFYEYVTDSPDINYFYKSIPQEKAGNRRLGDTMGKMLGGSGSHNALIYNRGHPKDYDNWARITKDTSWSYKALLKHFKNAETYKGIWPVGSQHGTQGPLHLETKIPAFFSVWKEAAGELGYSVGDPNGPQTEGFTPSEVTRKGGRRVSAFNSYVQPFLWRTSLTVARYAFVHKVLFHKHRATGVEYVRHGMKMKAYAAKEVIISAGTYASPLILMKSGIGPGDVLGKANIQQLAELPVGHYLQNHIGPLLTFRVSDTSKLSNVKNNLTQADFEQYLNHLPEQVLSENSIGPQAFLVSPEAKERDEGDWPDVQYFHIGTNFGGPSVTEETPVDQFTMAVLVGRPEVTEDTVGTVTMNVSAYKGRSTDNAQLAVIDYNFMASETDLRVLKYAIDTALNIFETAAFKSIGTRLKKDTECKGQHSFGTQAYWNCCSAKTARTWFHAVGTCRMGEHNGQSVVDSKLRVHGLRSLRVVDASVMPVITNANTNAATILIAEKASADILQQHEVKP